MESTIIENSKKKDEIMEQRNLKREASKEKAQVPSMSNSQANQPPQEGENNKKKIGGNHIPPATGSQEFKRRLQTMFSTWPTPSRNSRTKWNKE
ncbi:hypothetical protein O181_132597 [Austropuccinia psidii MF-1]|uniref:Uncharacterized protein n=1 Tax=Austropuccinia psidii MF-1 TaxID=1389203 RepID=A0A9Q3QDY9_9BASI|nr:hypothetical protein [Austropuccinia psidii MF-1]